MRRNVLIFLLVFISVALFIYSASSPDLLAVKTDEGNGIRVRGPGAESHRVYLGASSDVGFQGAWVYSIATADFPSSRISTHRLVLHEDGTASLIEESRTRVRSGDEADYRTETKIRTGTWSEHGDEAWIYLD